MTYSVKTVCQYWWTYTKFLDKTNYVKYIYLLHLYNVEKYFPHYKVNLLFYFSSCF